MTTQAPLSDKTLPFMVPTHLSKFLIPSSTFYEENAQYKFLATGAMVFRSGKLLLVQRSAHDSFPGAWEIPGGGCDDDDESILHGVARELMEETGLRVVKFVKQVGTGIEFTSRSGRAIFKYVFEVEVAGNQEISELEIKLDPNEHQGFRWVTLADIQKESFEGAPMQFVSEEQKGDLLRGFDDTLPLQ